MSRTVNVIDLFAGPGGLAEGFAAFKSQKGRHPFKILMSVEKEKSAHRTLELRAFFRSFKGDVPEAYYDYVRGGISRNELLEKYPAHAVRAQFETLYGPRELGTKSDDNQILERIRQYRLEISGESVVIGGPPCQAYSVVGRARRKGMSGYRAEKDKRHFLYKEYLKILAAAAPAVFVMENVKGILSSQVNGHNIFPRILDDLSSPAGATRKRSDPKYKIYSFVKESESPSDLNDEDYIICCEDYGIPQSRHRVILLGVREDIASTPDLLIPSPNILSVADAIRDMPALRSGLTEIDDSTDSWHETIRAVSKDISNELTKMGLKGRMASHAGRRSANINSRGGQFVPGTPKKIRNLLLRRWYTDSRIEGYLNHESRAHMTSDIKRYLYCACYTKQCNGESPRTHDMPSALTAKHTSWKSGYFIDRFKVQTAGRPSSTITSHISKDGHYFIHYDPAQCRSLTVREAARLQTFPDNYFFEGNRTEQFVQVGNAVPPLLARQIAAVVWGLLA